MMKKMAFCAAVLCLMGGAACAQTVYYNTDGGRYYHADPHCDTIDERYWDAMAEIQMEDAVQAGLRGACSRCVHLPLTLEYAQEDRLFYEECFESAQLNMHNPERDDPEYVYRNQARACDEMSENIRRIAARSNMLYGLASPQDVPRDEAIWTGYAALEQLAHVSREQMHRYYADAWLNISNPEQRIWQVYLGEATNLVEQNQTPKQYTFYIDAGTGEVLRLD